MGQLASVCLDYLSAEALQIELSVSYVVRACAERRKAAERKKQEENEAKGERTEEEHDVYML
jgi:hypothetical protein